MSALLGELCCNVRQLLNVSLAAQIEKQHWRYLPIAACAEINTQQPQRAYEPMIDGEMSDISPEEFVAPPVWEPGMPTAIDILNNLTPEELEEWQRNQ